MAAIDNYTDMTIRWDGHQKYKYNKIIENDPIEVIVQKLEMLLFTNKREILGQDSVNFGLNLDYYLWQTRIANDVLEDKIVKGINEFIPELNLMGYEININIFEGTVRDIMELNFTIKGFNILFVFK